MPTLQDRNTVGNISPPDTDDEESENENDVSNERVSLGKQQTLQCEQSDQSHQTDRTQKTGQSQRTPVKKPKKMSYEESLLNILKNKTNEEIDEDKSFLLSLLPSFKKLTANQKIEAKIQFLTIMKSFTPAPPSSFTTATSVNVGFQEHQSDNQRMQQSVGYRLPEYSYGQMMYHHPRLENVVIPNVNAYCSSTPTPTEVSQTSCASSNTISPQPDLFDL